MTTETTIRRGAVVVRRGGRAASTRVGRVVRTLAPNAYYPHERAEVRWADAGRINGNGYLTSKVRTADLAPAPAELVERFERHAARYERIERRRELIASGWY